MTWYELGPRAVDELLDCLPVLRDDPLIVKLRDTFTPPSPLELVEGQPDGEEEPSRKGLRCPYCQTVHWDGEEEGIRVVDVAVRWHPFGFDAAKSRITGSYDNDGDYETNTYQCESCEHDVVLPEGIAEDGW